MTSAVANTGNEMRRQRATVQVTTAHHAVAGAVSPPRAQTARHRWSDFGTAMKTAARGQYWAVVRVMLFMAWASLPLLAIVAHVFGLVSQRNSASLVVASGVMLVVLTIVAPHPSDVIIRRGYVAGIVACLPYDAFRLSAVHVGRWMGDFIPALGSWITEDCGASAAAVGYLWRYLGDAGGAGVGFYVVAFAMGLHRWSQPRRIVLAAVAYAVCPLWAGLIGVVALAPRGQELMFRLTPATVLITLIGHIIFGFALGVAFVSARDLGGHWPSPPMYERFSYDEKDSSAVIVPATR